MFEKDNLILNIINLLGAQVVGSLLLGHKYMFLQHICLGLMYKILHAGHCQSFFTLSVMKFSHLCSGAALDKKAEYAEDTSDSVCTQYSSRNCDKY